MEDKKREFEEEMSNTFIGEINQKSAIAKDDVEQLDVSTDSKTVFPEVAIEPPKDTLEEFNNIENNNLNNVNKEEQKEVPNYETESMIFENPNNKKNHPVLIIFLMLLCLAIGAGGTYYYFEVLNKETSKSDNKELTTDKKQETEEINPESYFLKSLVERYDYNSIEGTYQYLYSQEKTTIETLDETYVRLLIAQEANKSLAGAYFTSEEFKEAKNLLFGTKLSLSDQTIQGKTCVQIKYDATTKSYTYIEPNGCGGTTARSYIKKIVKGTKSSNGLEITVAIGITTSDGKVYKGEDKDKNLTDEVMIDNGQTFDIDNDYTKLNQYKYTFDYDKEENNYTLNNIELVK